MRWLTLPRFDSLRSSETFEADVHEFSDAAEPASSGRSLAGAVTPNLHVRVVWPVKYLNFYKVDAAETVLTVVFLTGRVIVSCGFCEWGRNFDRKLNGAAG